MLRHLVILLLLTGCADLQRRAPEVVVMREVESSVSDIRAAISAIMPVGNRSISSNGREMVSRHFLHTDGTRFRPATDAIERYYAQFIILGDRRPYNVEILVAHEKRVLRGETFMYVIDYYDQVLAKDLARKLERELAKRREDRNIIDDFRVF